MSPVHSNCQQFSYQSFWSVSVWRQLIAPVLSTQRQSSSRADNLAQRQLCTHIQQQGVHHFWRSHTRQPTSDHKLTQHNLDTAVWQRQLHMQGHQ